MVVFIIQVHLKLISTNNNKSSPRFISKTNNSCQGAGAAEHLLSVKDDLMLDGIMINGYDAATPHMIQLRYVIHVQSKEA